MEENQGNCVFIDALDACVEKDQALPCDLFRDQVGPSA